MYVIFSDVDNSREITVNGVSIFTNLEIFISLKQNGNCIQCKNLYLTALAKWGEKKHSLEINGLEKADES